MYTFYHARGQYRSTRRGQTYPPPHLHAIRLGSRRSQLHTIQLRRSCIPRYQTHPPCASATNRAMSMQTISGTSAKSKAKLHFQDGAMQGVSPRKRGLSAASTASLPPLHKSSPNSSQTRSIPATVFDAEPDHSSESISHHDPASSASTFSITSSDSTSSIAGDIFTQNQGAKIRLAYTEMTFEMPTRYTCHIGKPCVAVKFLTQLRQDGAIYF